MWFFDKNEQEKETHKKIKKTCENIKKRTSEIKGLIKDLACEEEAREEPKKKQLSEASEANDKTFRQGSKAVGEWGLNGIIN